MDIIEIDIDGFISQWEYSSKYIKACLSNAGDNPVVCRVCSRGGDFFMGMAIKDEFARNGNVTVDISGYAASAATLLGLGAKHTRISDTSFYFIHKVLSPVMVWQDMNDDDLQVLIADLEKIKDENEKMTLVAAKAYADKCKKPVLDILSLMKEEKWLTAEEAKEWGFVDEVYKATGKTNFAASDTKLNMAGLPPFPAGKKNNQERFIDKIAERVANIIPSLSGHADTQDHQITNQMNMKNFEKINAVLQVPSLESTDGKGVYLNEVQLQAVETALANYAQEIETGKTNKAAFDNGIEKLNALHPDVAKATDFTAKLAVVSEKLAAKPGTSPSGVKETPTPADDGVDWGKMNSLDHMKEDQNSLV